MQAGVAPTYMSRAFALVTYVDFFGLGDFVCSPMYQQKDIGAHLDQRGSPRSTEAAYKDGHRRGVRVVTDSDGSRKQRSVADLAPALGSLRTLKYPKNGARLTHAWITHGDPLPESRQLDSRRRTLRSQPFSWAVESKWQPPENRTPFSADTRS